MGEIDDIIQAADQNTTQTTPPTETPEQKLGRVLNENADLKRTNDTLAQQQDKLRADMEALRSQITRPPVTQNGNANDEGWETWATKVVNEIPENDFIANTKDAVRRTLVRAGRDLADHTQKLANITAANQAAVMRADMEFDALYPDLATDMGEVAKQQAIQELVPDPRFQNFLKMKSTRPKAWSAVATLARKKLGISNEMNPMPEEGPPQRRSSYSAPSGFRPTAPGATDEPKDKTGVADIVEYQTKTGQR
jgi:hypothetical protein